MPNLSSELNLTDEASFALNVSRSVARDFGHSEVNLAHLASTLFFMDEHIGCKIVSSAKQVISNTIKIEEIKHDLDNLIRTIPNEHPLPFEASFSSSLDSQLRLIETKKQGLERDYKISVEDLLLLVYEDEKVRNILDDKHSISKGVARKLLAKQRLMDLVSASSKTLRDSLSVLDASVSTMETLSEYNESLGDEKEVPTKVRRPSLIKIISNRCMRRRSSSSSSMNDIPKRDTRRGLVKSKQTTSNSDISHPITTDALQRQIALLEKERELLLKATKERNEAILDEISSLKAQMVPLLIQSKIERI